MLGVLKSNTGVVVPHIERNALQTSTFSSQVKTVLIFRWAVKVCEVRS